MSAKNALKADENCCEKWLYRGTVGLKVFSVNHRDHDLAAVELLSPLAQADLELQLQAAPMIEGCVVLATCNRIEIMVDTADAEAATKHLQLLFAQAAAAAGKPPAQPREYQGRALITHLCELACGLESMVVGEREITGQLRYAARRARRLNTITPLLVDALDTALKAARIVEKETGLSGMGRSVAAVALTEAEKLVGSYPHTTVTLFGTGSYAGAVVTQLRERGCENIYVHSNSGRAQAFAAGRGLTPVDSKHLAGVLANCDLIISCRGIGQPTVTYQHVKTGLHQRSVGPRQEGGRPLVILDLAVVRDIDPRVGQIPGVELIDLQTVCDCVPQLQPEITARARELANSVAEEFLRQQAARLIDPVIVSMRAQMQTLVENELQQLPQRQLTPADVERALRRFSNRLLHHPTTVAKVAGATGKAEEFVAALELLTGIKQDAMVKETT